MTVSFLNLKANANVFMLSGEAGDLNRCLRDSFSLSTVELDYHTIRIYRWTEFTLFNVNVKL